MRTPTSREVLAYITLLVLLITVALLMKPSGHGNPELMAEHPDTTLLDSVTATRPDSTAGMATYPKGTKKKTDRRKKSVGSSKKPRATKLVARDYLGDTVPSGYSAR